MRLITKDNKKSITPKEKYLNIKDETFTIEFTGRELAVLYAIYYNGVAGDLEGERGVMDDLASSIVDAIPYVHDIAGEINKRIFKSEPDIIFNRATIEECL